MILLRTRIATSKKTNAKRMRTVRMIMESTVTALPLGRTDPILVAPAIVRVRHPILGSIHHRHNAFVIGETHWALAAKTPLSRVTLVHPVVPMKGVWAPALKALALIIAVRVSDKT